MTYEIQIKTIDDKQYHYNSDDWIIDIGDKIIKISNFKTGNEICFVLANVIKWQNVEVE